MGRGYVAGWDSPEQELGVGPNGIPLERGGLRLSTRARSAYARWRVAELHRGRFGVPREVHDEIHPERRRRRGGPGAPAHGDIEVNGSADFVRRLFEQGWNAGSFDFLEGRTAAVIPMHYNGRTMEVTPESLPRLVATWREAFPDLVFTIRHLVAEGALVAVSLVLRGTQRGPWWGVPASGTQVEVEEMMFFRFERGILVEMWELFDEATLKEQIGGSAGA